MFHSEHNESITSICLSPRLTEYLPEQSVLGDEETKGILLADGAEDVTTSLDDVFNTANIPINLLPRFHNNWENTWPRARRPRKPRYILAHTPWAAGVAGAVEATAQSGC